MMQMYCNGLIFLEVTSSQQILKSHLQNYKIFFCSACLSRQKVQICSRKTHLICLELFVLRFATSWSLRNSFR